MWIDTQGSELLVLYGAIKILNKVSLIFIEVSIWRLLYINAPILKNLEIFLKKFGFTIFQLSVDSNGIGNAIFSRKKIFMDNQIIDHLKYYKSLNKEITVDLKDLILNKIYSQRFNFYFLMGLTPSDFNNKSFLEFGSGTGYNAYYLIKKCNIKKITCVEKNYNSLKKMKKNLVNFKNVKIKNEDISSYEDKKKYDFVICENTIDNFLYPSALLKKMMKLCRGGGGVLLLLLAIIMEFFLQN